MKVVLQRVSKASVVVEHQKIAKIKNGLLILLGIVATDSETEIVWLSKKIANLRIFNDEKGVMNQSLLAINGEAMVVSQFTLQASTKKGNRPSYIKAAKSDVAIPLYQKFIAQLEKDIGKTVRSGKFGADMQVSLTNDGPVTMIIDTNNKE